MSTTSEDLRHANEQVTHHQERVIRWTVRVGELARELEAEAVAHRTPRINVELLDRAWEEIEAGIRAEMVMNPLLGLHEIRTRHQVDGWAQQTWRNVAMTGDRCETTRCVAGWVAQLDAMDHQGAGSWLVTDTEIIDLFQTESVREEYEYANRGLAKLSWLEPRDDDPADHVRTSHLHQEGVAGIRYVTVENRATRLLGLTVPERERLFDYHNDLDALRLQFATLRAEELIRRARHDAWVKTEAAKAQNEATGEVTE